MTRRSRSRERSPDRREKRRSRSRDRDRRHRHRRSRSRSRSPKRYRSRSPHRRSISPRRRSRSRSHDRKDRPGDDPAAASSSTDSQAPVTIDESQLEGKSEEEIFMMKTMGFCGFDSTKNKQVNKGDTYVANIQRKRRYRQYMNRKGGFNRPLDFIA